MFTALIAMISKEFRQTFRDRRVMTVLFAAPMIQLLVFGYVVNMDVTEVPTVLVDQDHSAAAREFLENMVAGDSFKDEGFVDSGAQAVRLLERGEVTMAVIVPRGFSTKLKRHQTAQVQVLVDGGDSNRAMVALNNARSYITQRAVSMLQQRMASLNAVPGAGIARIEAVPRVFYNPALNSQIFYVPGVAATVLLVVVIIVTALGLAREKESGTLEQVMVTPISPAVLIAGKVIPYAIIGLIDLALVLTGGAFVFDLPLRGSLLLTFGCGAVYILNVLGLGLLISTLAKNQQQAFVSTMFVTLPGILLSGFLTPVENMPTWMQPITLLNPVFHFISILRAVLIKQATLGDILPHLVMLLGMGTAIFLLAAVSLRRSLT